MSLGDFDQFDITLEQVVDQGAEVDALGLGAFAEVVADLGIEVTGKSSAASLRKNLARWPRLKSYSSRIVVAPVRVLSVGLVLLNRGQSSLFLHRKGHSDPGSAEDSSGAYRASGWLACDLPESGELSQSKAS